MYACTTVDKSEGEMYRKAPNILVLNGDSMLVCGSTYPRNAQNL